MLIRHTFSCSVIYVCMQIRFSFPEVEIDEQAFAIIVNLWGKPQL